MRNKKGLCVILFLILILSLSGCGEKRRLVDHGMDVVKLIEEAINSEEYVMIYSASEQIARVIDGVAEGDFSEPEAVYSITIDEDLMDAANLIAGEKVHIVDNNNGERFETYIIKGERGSGCICLNGAAARKVQVGDIVIIMSYAMMDFEEAKSFKPSVVFPDSTTNKLV